MLQTISLSTNPIRPEPIVKAATLAGLVGNTPLLPLKRIADDVQLPPRVELYAKAEWFNPSGSVKDRPALNIILTAERERILRPGMTLLDSTSGNMGIAYAMFCASMGYRVKLAVPENASPERMAIMKAYGAELIVTDPLEGPDGAQREARRLSELAGEECFYAAQYDNPANWMAHYHTTAEEIWSQTQGKITHFVAGLGTSGTFVGTTRKLKEINPELRTVAMQPDSPFNGLEGLKYMETAIRPGIYDPSLADEQLFIRTEEAYEMAKKLARLEGLFVGFSAAAAVAASLQVARGLTSGVVVTILPDSGHKYVSDRLWGG